jgi:hypothetical protein
MNATGSLLLPANVSSERKMNFFIPCAADHGRNR